MALLIVDISRIIICLLTLITKLLLLFYLPLIDHNFCVCVLKGFAKLEAQTDASCSVVSC